MKRPFDVPSVPSGAGQRRWRASAPSPAHRIATSTSQPDEVGRALSAFVRAEFETPVAALRDLIEGLGAEAAAAGIGSYADDVARMIASCDALSALIGRLLTDGAVGTEPADASRIRHDLRTPVSSIIGYAELIAEEARESGHDWLFSPLADVLDVAGHMLRDLDRLVHVFSLVSGEAPVGGARGALPDVLRVAADAVGLLVGQTKPVPTRVTGDILVVDDNASMRNLVVRRLTREGHRVEACSGGHAALRLAANKPFDLMLLDLMMPGMTGLEVLVRLRGNEATRDLPVIVISALDEMEMSVRCIEAGADDYLPKPLNETLLRARISASLERKFLRDSERRALERVRIEQARADSLLRNVLPASVVERLAAGETTIADHFDDASVLFCDIVGFTELAGRTPPGETLRLLNAVFSAFDELAERHELEKIKTVGDAYMVVGGISPPFESHVERMVGMARSMPAAALEASGEHRVAVRIGIACGPVVAGVIGSRKFFYDVWGATVNTASRLEAAASPGMIHVTQEVVAALGPRDVCKPLGPLELRGIGARDTYAIVV